MANKIFKNLISPFFKAGTILLILFVAGFFYFNLYAGILSLLCSAGFFIYTNKVSKRKNDLFEEYAKNLTDEMEETIRHFLYRNPFPLCMIDAEDNILWFNGHFRDIYHEAEMLNSSIRTIAGIQYKGLVQGKKESKSSLISHKDRTFRVLYSTLEEKKNGNIMLYWLDVTELEALGTAYQGEKLCFAYANVDNYDELIASSPDEKKSVLASQIETVIRQWGSRYSATVVKYNSGKYYIVFEQKHLEKLEAGKFAILDEIRSVETDSDFPASLSMGIGVGGSSLPELEEFGLSALDLALGRGGDQAVVKRPNRIEYYGGKLQTVEKRNKGKSRIMAHALNQLIDQSNKVIIMGHKNPDMDSIGSALGVYRIVKNRNKEVGILLPTYGKSLDKLLQRIRETNQYRLVTVEEARSMVDGNTLLVVVDTHRPKLLDCPELLSMTDQLVVFDHHRKSEDSIDNATLTYMEAYASSTSELVTEMMQYTGDGKKAIEKLEAEALLAGITVDTNSFTMKTGVRTFEAASWLRRNGADTSSVRQFFQTDMDFFKIKASIIANAEILPKGYAISICYGQHQNVEVLTSQAADELLNINEVRASFVVGSNEKGLTVISARSLGEINVQLLMEKLGGGGHLMTAGAQSEKSMDETVEDIKEFLRDLD